MADLAVKTTESGYPYFEVSDLGVVRDSLRRVAESRAEYVHDTYVKRDSVEKINHVTLGLVAQWALAASLDFVGVPYVSYEDTRIDAGENDDPFDFILVPRAEDAVEIATFLKERIYPRLNSQGKLRLADRLLLRATLDVFGARIANLKSSVDNHVRGIESIVANQNHIAYATDKNRDGFVDVEGASFLAKKQLTLDQYLSRKQAVGDFNFTVFFPDRSMEIAYYVGFVSKEQLVLEGVVGPLQGSYPWVGYHKVPITSGNAPGSEREVVFAAGTLAQSSRASRSAPR